MYWWDTPAGVDRKGNPYPAIKGWYDLDEEGCYDDVPLAPGEGLWMTMPSDEFKVVSNGEVLNDTLPVELVRGNQLCPNPTPIALTLGQVKMTGDYDPEDGYEETQVYCCKLNIYGVSGTLMYWWDTPAGVDRKGNPYPAIIGWYDLDEEGSYNDVEIKVGESLWMTVPSDNWMVTWPNPLVKNVD